MIIAQKEVNDDSNEDDTTVMGTSTMAFPCLSSLNIRNCPLNLMPLYPSLDEYLMLSNTSSRPLKQTIKMNITSRTPSSSTSSLPLSPFLYPFICIYMCVYVHTHTHTHTRCDCLYMLGPGNGTFRRCGPVGVGVSLWVSGFKTLILAAWKRVFW